MPVVVTHGSDWCRVNCLVLLLTLWALRAAETPSRRRLPPLGRHPEEETACFYRVRS